MKTAITRLATATMRGLVIPVVVIAGLFACSDTVVEPHAIEGPTEYELVTDILSQPRGPTTSRRLNIAQGQDPNVARRHLRLWATTPDGNTLFQPGEIKAVRRMPPGEWAADGDTPEPRCEFVTGGSAEEYNAFKECKKAAKEDENCDAEDEDVSILVRDEDGGFRVVIIALHVHCVDEEGGAATLTDPPYGNEGAVSIGFRKMVKAPAGPASPMISGAGRAPMCGIFAKGRGDGAFCPGALGIGHLAPKDP